jgi:hypothetical protein
LRSKVQKLWQALCLVIILINLGVVVFLVKRNWLDIAPVLSTVKRRALGVPTVEEEFAMSSERILQLVQADKTPSKTELIDGVRSFVFHNSVHKVDEEFEQYKSDIHYLLERMIQTAEKENPPPHSACGPRTIAMRIILAHAGIQSRIVEVYSDNYDQLVSHVFLEVFNPDSQRWEVQDPDLNIYYVHKETGERLSVMELCFGDLEQAVPVSDETRGWEESGVQNLKDDYFETIIYHPQGGKAPPIISGTPLILVNTQRFNLDKRFPDNGSQNLIEFLTSVYTRYDEPLVLSNQTVR